jgi:oligopeptide/dipeptide ABC transporter ATP-binding protein
LKTIPGAPPIAQEHRVGCPFAGRCALTIDICRNVTPPEIAFEAAHVSRCHRAAEVGLAP